MTPEGTPVGTSAAAAAAADDDGGGGGEGEVQDGVLAGQSQSRRQRERPRPRQSVMDEGLCVAEEGWALSFTAEVCVWVCV